jgi:integrase
VSDDDRLFKRGKIWYGWFYQASKQVIRSTRCTDKRAAISVRAGWERAAADPAYRTSHETTLGGAIMQVIADRAERQKSDGTLKMLATKGSHLERLLGRDTVLARIDARVVDGYVSARRVEGASDPTIYKEWSTLLGALKIAKRRGQYQGDLEAIRPLGLSGVSKARKRFLTRDELEKLVTDLADDELTQRRCSMKARAAQVLFIVATGARWIESVRAHREDIDQGAGTVELHGTKTDGAARVVPFGALPFGAELMRRCLDLCPPKGRLFRPWTSMPSDLRRACVRLKLAPVSPNDLRRTTATWLRQAGAPPHLIALVLGHADSRMVERVYGRMPVDSLADAIRRETAHAEPPVPEQGGKVIQLRRGA